MAIVCGTDLSESSAEATVAAAAIASLLGHDVVIVVHVNDEDVPEAQRSDRAAQARTALEPVAARARAGLALTIRHEVIFGPPVDSIVGVADTEGAEMIVVGALGKVGVRIVEASAVPVLIVRGAAPFVAWGRGERPLRALLGIDDSLSSEAAVTLVKAMRRRSAIDVVLGTVYYADEAARHFGLHVSSAVDANPEVERLLSRDLLRRFGVTTGAGTITARPVVGAGRLGDHLLELAEAEAVDAIVVGTHQKGGIGRLGSVSAHVAHDAPRSVLCVPPTTRLGRPEVPVLTTAVVATDLSTFGNRVVPYGFALVGERGQVHIVHVRDDDPGAERAAIEGQLMALVPSGALAATQAHVLVGDDPAELIAETAARIGADVICIASHGRSGITRALVGSVADRLMRHTRLPVLMLRPKL